MPRIKRAIMVAAGIGKRMQPVTLNTPKPLISVNGTRIMDNTIECLRKNGVEDIYIVVGHKKECFHDLYDDDPNIHIIENNHYLEGNNITSLYEVRDYLPESFVLEGDLIIKDHEILDPDIQCSGYCASWMEVNGEWLLDVEEGKIKHCITDAHQIGYQLWGISMWTKADGERLSKRIAEVYESGNWDIYWDEIALFQYPEEFELGIREISKESLQEIDTFEELKQVDPTYEMYEHI